MKRRLATIIALVLALGYASSVFAATFGLTANNGSVQTNSTDRKYVYSATPATSGTVTAGTARIWLSAAGSSNAKLVIYSDNAGSPDALLATSDEVTVNWTTETATDFTFSGANQIAVTGGTAYWIGIHFSDPGTPNFTISRANNAGLVRSDPDTYSDGPTATCSCATSSNGGLDIYITYTEGAAEPSLSNPVNIKGGVTFKGGVTIK
jgi:hypothetical protein